MGPVAIVGIGCRFPQADGPLGYWRLLRDGVDAISEIPEERWDRFALYSVVKAPGTMNTRFGGFLDRIDRFDAEFFGVSPREARRMDPQQRLLLEVAWEALEDAGYVPDGLASQPVGVFVGVMANDYVQLQIQDLSQIDVYVGSGNGHAMTANRLSYQFHFTGPSVAVDTACSSSLTAVHYACRSLAAGECRIALAGGVNLIVTPALQIFYTQAGISAPDGRCKPFSAGANGIGRGEGAGVAVLKRLDEALADGDAIYAVIRGSAVNHNGHSNGLTAPSRRAQEQLLRAAYASAGVSPGDVQYVEAHGTGTLLGDPIEAKALGAVMASGRAPGSHCKIGSVKSNFGHLEGAAGVAGLLKTVLALHHREIPPSLHFDAPNPYIPFASLAIRVQDQLPEWPESDRPALAGVSSFGLGGANAHVVIERGPADAKTGTAPCIS
jgi:phthiocerol/phenolphthiocerol synthesis type-I polyketide synthase C